MNDFGFTTQETPDALIVRFSGHIDEESDLGSISVDRHKVIVIDLKDVVMINSLGVRSWIIWSRDALRGKIVTFRNCPRVIVDQINMVAQFLPEGARVESFYTPYQCDACDGSGTLLFTRGAEYSPRTSDAPARVELPQAPACPLCRKVMELDVIEAKYFRFLRA